VRVVVYVAVFLQCLAVCCSALQCVGLTMLIRHLAVEVRKRVHRIIMLQTQLSALQCVAVLQSFAVFCSALQCIQLCCSVLQCVAVCCGVLEFIAVCCGVLYL